MKKMKKSSALPHICTIMNIDSIKSMNLLLSFYHLFFAVQLRLFQSRSIEKVKAESKKSVYSKLTELSLI